MNLIALVDKKWGIANKGRELVDIPEDKKPVSYTHLRAHET